MTNQKSATQLFIGATFEDSNENTFKVIKTDRGFELMEDGTDLLEDGDLYVFESLQEIEDMFDCNDNPITIHGNDVDSLRSLFVVHGSELDADVGRPVKVHRQGTRYDQNAKIVGVQNMWGYNEQGVYTFPVLGYVVDFPDAYGPCPCSKADIEFLDGGE